MIGSSFTGFILIYTATVSTPPSISYKDNLFLWLVGDFGLIVVGPSLIWWKSIFKDDFYIELMRHGQENEDHVNESLIKLVTGAMAVASQILEEIRL